MAQMSAFDNNAIRIRAKIFYVSTNLSRGVPMTDVPPVRRRLLGAALRRFREVAGYTLEDAARILECDRSKISRIETGQRGIRPKELRELLDEYGVEPDRRDALLT